MISKTYLLDTNSAIARLKGDRAVTTVLEMAEAVFLSSIVLGELYFGVYKSKRVEENTRRIEEFSQGRSILACDAETARIYGRLFWELRSKGRPIPQNDVWIAAIALQHHLTLLTRDRHFEEVENLPVQSW